MPTEVVIGFLVTAVSALASAVVYLAKRHFDEDGARQRELEAWKTLALASGADVGKLVPSVANLALAVEAEHRVAQDFRGGIARKVDEVHGDLRELLGRRAR